VPGTFSFVDARDVAETQWAVLERGRRGERYLSTGRNTATESRSDVGTPDRRKSSDAPYPMPMLYLIKRW
jgi:dihydroflavonol-4-reductase